MSRSKFSALIQLYIIYYNAVSRMSLFMLLTKVAHPHCHSATATDKKPHIQIRCRLIPSGRTAHILNNVFYSYIWYCATIENAAAHLHYEIVLSTWLQ